MSTLNKVIIAVLLMAGITAAVHAQVLSRPFGGMRLSTEYCKDTGGSTFAIMVRDAASGRPLRLLYVPGASRLFLNFNILLAPYLLGSYTPVPFECNGGPTDGTMDMGPGTGTS